MLRVLFLVGCFPALSQAQCEIAGELSHSDLQVTAGTQQFGVRVRDVPVRVVPARRDHTVHVDGAIQFTARADSLPFGITRRVETGHGILSVTSSVQISHVREDAPDITARVQLNPWVRIRRVSFPCDSVRVGEGSEAQRLQEELPPHQDLLRARRRVLVVRSAPRESATHIQVRLQRDAVFTFHRVGTRGTWYQIVWTDGSSRLLGWVRRADVRRSGRHGWGTTGGSGEGRCLLGSASIHGGYDGPADIREGTEVRSAADGEVWGRVGRGEFRVRYGPNDAFARITAATGIRGEACELTHAFVPRSAVTPLRVSG